MRKHNDFAIPQSIYGSYLVALLGAGLVTPVLWRAVNEHGEVLDVLLQENRDTGAAKRFFMKLVDNHELPERIVTDRLKSYGAALRRLPELSVSEHVTVTAAERQNNLIEQSHRLTREQEQRQRGFRVVRRTQGFLFTHAIVNGLFEHTRASTWTQLRQGILTRGFSLWAELSLFSLKTSQQLRPKRISIVRHRFIQNKLTELLTRYEPLNAQNISDP